LKIDDDDDAYKRSVIVYRKEGQLVRRRRLAIYGAVCRTCVVLLLQTVHVPAIDYRRKRASYHPLQRHLAVESINTRLLGNKREEVRGECW